MTQEGRGNGTGWEPSETRASRTPVAEEAQHFVIENSATAVADRPTPGDDKLLLTVEEAANRLGIGRTVMYRLVSTGAVESVTLGRLRRIPSECLAEFVSALRHNATGTGDRRRATAA